MTKPIPLEKELYDIIGLAEYVEETYNITQNLRDVWFWFVDRYEVSNGSVVNVSLTPDERDKPEIAVFKSHLRSEFGDSIEVLAQW